MNRPNELSWAPPEPAPKDWWAIAGETLKGLILACLFLLALYIVTGFIYVVGA